MLADRIIDSHTHTTLSDGRLTPYELEIFALNKGVKFGIADHLSNRHSINSDETFIDYLENIGDIDCFKSAEIDIEDDLPVSVELIDSLDYLIGGVHSLDIDGENRYFFADGGEILDGDYFMDFLLDKMIGGIEKHPVDIIAHANYIPAFVEGTQHTLWTKKRSLQLIEVVKEYGVFIEISNHWKVPGRKFMELAISKGVNFSLGSDGHSKESVFDLGYPLKIVREFNIPAERLFYPIEFYKRYDRMLLV
jgi:histidinol phosphatase-like PHP family hydrolase